MGPATLVRLLAAHDPSALWELIRTGEVERAGRSEAAGRGQSWASLARQIDPERLVRGYTERGIEVTWWGDDRYPSSLLDDPEPPGVLFWRGDLGWLAHRTVALIGTRRCTPDGRAIAFELGRDLAAAGVCVVSGLALGIDGAAHLGALSASGAGTVGVAASGVDVAYPPRHAHLWEEVVAHGLVCAETPPGSPAQAWRFPSRNRVIAGLSRMVVVVESHAGGGSMITVDAALRRNLEVRAVPGSIRSPASAGPNQLLADGAAPVRHAGDILDALGELRPWPPEQYHLRPTRPPRNPTLDRTTPAAPTTAATTHAAPPLEATRRARPVDLVPPARPVATDVAAKAVLDAVGWRPSTLNAVADRSGLPVGVVVSALHELEGAGLVTCSGAWWSRHRVP
jgi:DNA processing protein